MHYAWFLVAKLSYNNNHLEGHGLMEDVESQYRAEILGESVAHRQHLRRGIESVAHRAGGSCGNLYGFWHRGCYSKMHS